MVFHVLRMNSVDLWLIPDKIATIWNINLIININFWATPGSVLAEKKFAWSNGI